MKSEKAKEGIERFRHEFVFIYSSGEICEFCRLFGEIVEIAEQEAEERAVEAFKTVFNNLVGDTIDNDQPELVEFIEELNK